MDVPVVLADCLGLEEGMLVSLRACPRVPDAASVTVEPLEPDDWEVASRHAYQIEECLLTQQCLAAVDQSFPFWPENQAPIRLRCVAATPTPVVRPHPLPACCCRQPDRLRRHCPKEFIFRAGAFGA